MAKEFTLGETVQVVAGEYAGQKGEIIGFDPTDEELVLVRFHETENESDYVSSVNLEKPAIKLSRYSLTEKQGQTETAIDCQGLACQKCGSQLVPMSDPSGQVFCGCPVCSQKTS